MSRVELQLFPSRAEATPVWTAVAATDDIPAREGRVVHVGGKAIAVFNLGDRFMAVDDRCPHKGGHLSQGIVFGKKVACPLHGWHIGLEDGVAVAPDEGCAASFPVKLEGGKVFISLTPNEGCPNI